jgi:hypothetical protein
MIRWKQKHILANEKTDAINTLRVLTRVTSTQLAVTGDYHLGRDTRDRLINHWNQTEKRQQEVNARKNDRKKI